MIFFYFKLNQYRALKNVKLKSDLQAALAKAACDLQKRNIHCEYHG
jgi:hypothetical protein